MPAVPVIDLNEFRSSAFCVDPEPGNSSRARQPQLAGGSKHDWDGRYVVYFSEFGWGPTGDSTIDEPQIQARDLLRELMPALCEKAWNFQNRHHRPIDIRQSFIRWLLRTDRSCFFTNRLRNIGQCANSGQHLRRGWPGNQYQGRGSAWRCNPDVVSSTGRSSHFGLWIQKSKQIDSVSSAILRSTDAFDAFACSTGSSSPKPRLRSTTSMAVFLSSGFACCGLTSAPPRTEDIAQVAAMLFQFGRTSPSSTSHRTQSHSQSCRNSR